MYNEVIKISFLLKKISTKKWRNTKMGLFGSKGPNLAALKGLIQNEYSGITFT